MPRVFALADTHFGFGVGKTMDRFGDEWIGHPEKIRVNTLATVAPDDVLLLPGDLSWASKRRDTEQDLALLAALPGFKIAIKGNHDYWWDSDTPIGYEGLHNPPIVIGPPTPPIMGGATEVASASIGFAGTRGWNRPIDGTPTFATDTRTFERERRRLQKSLDAIAGCQKKIALLHYPPQPFLDILAAAGVESCVYGHVHVNSLPEDEILAVYDTVLEGVRCYCVAADRIDFTPQLIASF